MCQTVGRPRPLFEPRIFEFFYRPLLDEAGRVLGLIHGGRDLTTANNPIEPTEKNVDLERRVSERMAAMQDHSRVASRREYGH